ncbi:MAG: UMP kinase [archaeon]
MNKKVIVLSLGGSLIFPKEVDVNFLREFKKVVNANKGRYKFIVVCGGGSVARKYIMALRKTGVDKKTQSLAGISATRMNARFVSYFFGMDQKRGIPHRIGTIRRLLKKQDVVFCGALKYKPKQTSDSTAAEIAKKFKADFVNLTNVKGLHDKNPKTNKNVKFIPRISWKDFDKMANKIGFKPGQHFVLDQTASGIIMKNKIPTYIIKSMKQLDNLLKGKRFVGTTISD